MPTYIRFKYGIPHIEGRPVRNVKYLMELLNKYNHEKVNYENSDATMIREYGICPLHWVPDGDFVFVIGDDLTKRVARAVCSCGVSYDMHGTCCGFENAKTAIDENGRICDDRHPFYNRNYNEWINQRFVTQNK